MQDDYNRVLFIPELIMITQGIVSADQFIVSLCMISVILLSSVLFNCSFCAC